MTTEVPEAPIRTDIPAPGELADFGEKIEKYMWEIQSFIATPEFQAVLTEIYSKRAAERQAFVNKILFDNEQLSQRSIKVPNGLIIQRSRFGDERPNLFCIKKFVRHGINVNITFPVDGPRKMR